MGTLPRKASPAVFVLILICFLLPFVTFSCQGQKVATFSGIQLVTGTTIQQPQMFGPPQQQKVDPEPLALLAALTALAGLAFSFLKGGRGAIPPAIAGGLGIVFMLALKSKVEGDVLRQGQGVIQVSYEVGFYVAVILFVGALLINGYALVQGSGVSAPLPRGAPGDRFCTQCGSRNAAADLFCKECGAKFA